MFVFQRTIADDQGNTIPSAEITVFLAGTPTIATLFSDGAGLVPLTNPFNADANGFIQFYVASEVYDIDVNAGAAVWSDVQIGFYIIPETYTKTEVYNKTETYNKTEVYNKTETDNALVLKANQATTYTKTETDTLLDDKADVGNTVVTDDSEQTKIGSLDINNDVTVGESIPIVSWSYVGTTITLVVSAHNVKAGKTASISGLLSTTNTPNGAQTVTSVTATTIVYTALEPTGLPTVSSALVEYGGITVFGKASLNQNVKIVDFGTVSGNTRYVIDNPFGNANYEGCIVRAEIFYNSIWSESGYLNDQSTNASTGTVGFSNLEGIVIECGSSGVLYAGSNRAGGGHGTPAATIASAPCRVIVTYIGEAKDA